MKKNIKILTLALSLLLIIGAVIGVTAFAADAPSVEIVRKNISYDGAVKTLYAIDAENIGTGKVAVQFYSVDPSTEGATADYTKFASEKITLDDAEYDVVFSTGFRPTELRKSIFAVPVIIDGDKVVAKGAAVEYSPYIYAMNRFDKEATSDQLTLYTALLEYGAAVQRILSTPDQVAASGGYADEYYAITVKNALTSDVTALSAGTTKTYSALDIAAGKAKADATYADKDFVAFANANGDPVKYADNAITSLEVKPGRTTFNALYGNYDIVRYESSDFTNGNPAGFIENTYNVKTVCANVNPVFASKDNPAWQGTSSLAAVNGTLVHTKELIDKETFTGTDANWGDCNYQWWRMWFTGSAGDQDIWIAEFDMKFENYTGEGSFIMEANDHTFRVSLSASKELDENGYIKYFSLGDTKLESGTFYKVRYVWFSDSDTVALYVDNKLAYTKTLDTPVTKDVNYNSFSFAYSAGLAGVTTFDNMYYATACVHNEYVLNTTVKDAIVKDANKSFYKSCTECKLLGTETVVSDGTKASGKYYNSNLTGTRYDMNTVPTFTKSSTDSYKYSVSNGVLNIENNAYGVNTIRVLNASGSMSSASLVPGSKFVAEFDFMYNGCDTASANNDTYQFMGLAKAENGGSGSCSWSGSYLRYHEKYYAHFEEKNIDAAMAMNVWYNYRLEYTLKDNGKATIDKYVNDVLVETISITADAPAVIYGWAFESRGASIPVSYSFDNMYFGVICAGEHDYQSDIFNMSSYLGDGKFAMSCTKCGQPSEETFEYKGVTLGNGTYFANADMSGYRWDYSGTIGSDLWVGTDKNKGTHVSGKTAHYNLSAIDGNNVLNLQVESDSIWGTSALRPAYKQAFEGVEVQAGDKLVAEFDFIIRDGKNTSDNCFIKLSLSAKSAGSDSGQFTPQFWLNANADGISHKLGTANLVEGYWYNVRIECTVGGEYAIYVNDVLAESGTYTGTPAEYKFYGLSVVTRGHKADVSFDNYYAAVNPTEAAAE